jgi:peptide deformylase
VPGVWPKIRRFKRATVTATDLNGHEFTEDGEGLYARCLQHEYDHIEGTTIVNRMGAAARIAHRRQLQRLADKHEGK